MDMSRRSTNSGNTDTNPPSDGVAHLTVDATVQHQTLIGFGAAVAWYGDQLVGFGADSPINDAAFHDLGLDVIRLRDHYNRQDSGASSDLTVDLTILARATASLGHPPKILLSSWSPPAALKASGKENCSTKSDPNNSSTCTLRQDATGFPYTEFANYFVESLDYYGKAGIVPDFLSIQNEPNYVPDGWEGCYFGGTQSATRPGYDQALSAVRSAIASAPAAPMLVGPEVINLDNGSLGSYVTDETRGNFGGIAHHVYSGTSWQEPDTLLPAFRDAKATANGLPVFQTEFDTQNDNGVGGGFETAWVIHNSLAVEELSAFLYWGLVWATWGNNPPSGGLIGMKTDSTTKVSTYTLRGQYYAMRHFSRYTDPGYVRVDAASTLSSVRATAYVAPDGSRLTLVLLNVGGRDASVQLDNITGFSAQPITAYRSVFRTDTDASTSEYWTPLEGLDPKQQFTLPSRSVLTVVWGDVSEPVRYPDAGP
jgi:glucuronoarabinoxylan endo-1,4-beta-xylanase